MAYLLVNKRLVWKAPHEMTRSFVPPLNRRTLTRGRGCSLAAAGLLLFWNCPATARDLCPERPGQTTPPCTIEPGHFILETSVADWALQQSSGSRVDTVTLGQSALRIGVAKHAEVTIGWTPLAAARTRDKATGLVNRQSGLGDVTLAVKRSFGDASSPNVAVKVYTTLPVGKAPSGLGDWSAGILVPVSLPLSKRVQLALTPEIDAAVNSSGDGRHLAAGSAVGMGFKLTDKISLGTDIRVLCDDDPNGNATKATAGLSLAIQSGDNLQFDSGSNFALNRNSPNIEVYFGISKRF